jgi:glycosyltransferase involved in cell wall biosynthesis
VSSPLRIALFTGNYNHIEDGVSRTLGRLVGYLEESGHRVLVVGPTVDNPPVRQPGTFAAAPSVPIPGRAEYRFTVGFPRALRQRVEAFRPHLVHVATPDVLGHRAVTWARAEALPVVATYHTHFASYLDYYGLGFGEGALWAAARRFYNRCDEVYVPTRAMEEALRAHGVRSTVRRWPRGIELDRFSPEHRSPAWRTARGLGPDDVVVTFVSRLVKEKGLDVYADVVRQLAGRGLPVRALVVGDGPEREALESDLPDAVFAGHLSGEELATAYASSDVFLFPSETETFGNVTLEAMASGLPVVAADAAGSRSLVESGETGLLCPPRDVDCFTDAAARLAADAGLRVRLGASAREEARAYSWPSVLARMERYYRGVLAAR